jgi:hypothetical protein
MLLGRTTKQPSETRRFKLDYSKAALDSGEYITSVITASSPDSVPPITTSVQLIEDVAGDATSVTKAYLYVGGGVDGNTYRITITSIPDDTNILWEDELEITVEDV